MTSLRFRLLLPCAAVLSAGASERWAQQPVAEFEPWFYNTDTTSPSFGRLMWDRHQFQEDTANTAFVLARNLVTLDAGHGQRLSNGQTPGAGVDARVDALYFNKAHFDPPEGDAPTNGTRRILVESIEGKGLQLFVNYSDAKVDATQSQRYPEPTFFLSLDAGNPQPAVGSLPPVPAAGLSSAKISATRGAFGHFNAVAKWAIAKLHHEEPNPPFTIDALYVTGGTPYGRLEFDPVDRPLWDTITRDRLFVRSSATSNTWTDQSTKIPAVAKDGNSSGVCFADFNGDKRMDLFVGKPGDDYMGAQNRLLLFNATTQAYDDRSTSANLPQVIDATVDVVASDIDLDGDPDIVVGNRARLAHRGAPGTEAQDYVLINNGSAVFTRVLLTASKVLNSDTRSVAVGDLDNDSRPDIVLGNAGGEGPFDHTTAIVDQRLQVFRRLSNGAFFDDAIVGTGGTTLSGGLPFFNPTEESDFTKPFVHQVMIADLYSFTNANPSVAVNAPDGKKDLVVVTHGELLFHEEANPFGIRSSHLSIFAQETIGGVPRLKFFSWRPYQWMSSVALGDFTCNNPGVMGTWPGMGTAQVGTLDYLVGAGNRFSGADPYYYENMGNLATSNHPFNPEGLFAAILSYDSFPGSERGYGVDLADVDADGDMDAIHASRMYNYLLKGVGKVDTVSAPDVHHSLTSPSSAKQLENARGRATPKGMEDGVFADFDRDGRMDILMAGQRFSSPSRPPSTPASDQASEVVILQQTTSGDFVHQSNQRTLNTFGNATLPGAIEEDTHMNIGARTAALFPEIADRAVAGDLDNDGDVDAIVHLFQIGGRSGQPSTPTLTQLIGAVWPTAPQPSVANLSVGWRYLQNNSTPGNIQFTDLAPTRMVDFTGSFSPDWNRGLGMDVLGDFDNNGYLDLYTTVGFSMDATNAPPVVNAPRDTVSNARMTDDLLFLNNVTAVPGQMLESSSQWIKQVNLTSGTTTRNAGSFGVAQGDIDNDGDADVLVTHGWFHDFTGFPSLYVNHFPNPNGLHFQDEYKTRVPTSQASLSKKVLSEVANGTVLDRYNFPAFLDFDADGDLDIVLQPFRNIPRFFQNQGQDVNGDNRIDATDGSSLGLFVDVTDSMVGDLRPTMDAQDIQPIDLDFDGDLDMVVDPFDDEVYPWESYASELNPAGTPAVSDAWPRVGAIRGTKVRFTGAGLKTVGTVEFLFAGGVVVPAPSFNAIDDHTLDVVLPTTPFVTGLAQIRVKNATGYSKQYFGYYFLQ